MKITVTRNSTYKRKIYKPGPYDLPNEVARALIDAGHALEAGGRVAEESPAQAEPAPESPVEETRVGNKKRRGRGVTE